MKILKFLGLKNLHSLLGNALRAYIPYLFAFALSFSLSTSILANPVLDNVAAGNVTVNQTPNSTIVNQASQKAIINWQSFNIGKDQSTHFQQPAGGIALNRINPSQGVSQIYGRLTATGQIILVNPAGIFFAPGSYVNVGSLIASTADISNQDFLNGYYNFANIPGYNGSIINQGQIIAADNGLVALIGGAVTNDGYIQANLGHAILASGDSFSMTFNGNNLISFSVDSGTTQQGTAIKNTGTIVANGGQILVSAKAASGILDNVINMQGVAQAQSIEDAGVKNDGEIILWGDGLTIIGGSLDASSFGFTDGGRIIVKSYALSVANGASFNVSSEFGDGGFVETSGTHELGIGNLHMNVASKHGKGGTWLIDPADINITTVDANISGSSPFTATATAATLNVATLTAALANGDVIVRTTNDGFAGSGNITVSSGITWTSAYKLTLDSFSNIIINAGISGINGSLDLQAGALANTITTGAAGTIDVGNFHLIRGTWSQVTGTLPAFNVRNSFTLQNDGEVTTGNARFIRALGGDGNSGTPYQLTDIYGIQGINSGGLNDMVHKNYILMNDIDASGTRTWNNGAGFHPIGYFFATGAGFAFNGEFNGNGKVIDGLHINRAATDVGTDGTMGVGLFGVTWQTVIHDLGLTNVDITATTSRAAGLVGFASWQASPIWSGGGSGAFFYNNYVTGNVTSYTDSAGGMFGYFGSGNNVSASYNAATVTSVNAVATGGLIGYLSSGSASSNNYNIGTVRGLSTGPVGGLVGYMETSTSVTNSYSSGKVTSILGNAGGLIGTRIAGSTLSNSFFDTDTSTQASAVGTGLTTGATGGCFNGTCVNGGTANLSDVTTYSNAGWSIASTGFTGTTPPAGTWLILDDQTRPMLRAEWSSSIRTPHQLQLMSTALGQNYSLARNIDISNSYSSAADVWGTGVVRGVQTGSGFIPVGDATNAYTGAFDGNYYTINGLYINRPSTSYVGLFGVHTGVLQEVGLTNVNIRGASYVGSLSGFASGDGTTILNSYVKNGTVTGTYRTGGLIGLGNSYVTSWNNLYADNVDVYGVSGIGGIAGGGQGGINNSYNINGSVNGTNGANAVGGIVGWWDGNPLTGLYNGSNITVGTGSYYIGGIAGEVIIGSNIVNTYNTGTISVGTGSAVVGGIVGVLTFNSVINSYNSGVFTNTTGISQLGGIAGQLNDANVFNSFWDVDTTGLGAAQSATGFSTTPGAVGYMGMTTAQMMRVSNFTVAANGFVTADNAWSITKTPSTTGTAPATTWYIFDATNAETGNATASSFTRPILMMEYQTNITNAHGLQLMGSTLGGNYTLSGDLDLTNSFNNVGDIWATNRNTATGYGFVAAGYSYQANANSSPLTQFVGTFNGQNYTISNLYVNKPHFGDTDSGGLFIQTGTGAVISNLNLFNASVTGASQGYAATGGLVAVMRGGTISNVAVSGSVTANGGGSGGGLVGVIDSGTNTITNSSFTGTLSGLWILSLGGLAGSLNNGTISNSYSAGSVTRSVNRDTNIGGLVGANSGTISNSYSISNINDTQASSAATTAGGLAGYNNGTITNSYSSGNVTSPNTDGGFIGNNAGTVNSSVWDTITSNLASAVGTGSSTGITAMTTTEMMTLTNFTTPGNGFVTSAWNITATPSTTSIAPTNTWFIFDGATRPMLMMEKSNTIRNAHQLQLIGTTLGGVYTLANNIDLSSSLNATNSAADVWGTRSSTPTGSGFYPIANGTNFTGSFNGQNYTISNLYINRASTQVGLFSTINQIGSIKNLGLINGSVSGSDHTGAIAGSSSGVISNVYNSGVNVTGGYYTGGIIGSTTSTNITLYTHNANNLIAGQSEIGGIIGRSFGAVADSWNSGSAQQASGLYYVGGIAGTNWGTIQTSYNIGHIYSVSFGGGIGGIAGTNAGTIAASYNNGFIDGTNAGQETGGLVGRNYGSIINSYNTGMVAGTSVPTSFPYIGGIAGWNTSGGTITNSYNAGYVTGLYGTYFGGLIGLHDGSAPAPITGSFWDTATSGQSAVVGSGTLGSSTYTGGCFGSTSCTNGGTVNMALLATFSGAPNSWNTTSLWTNLETISYPYLKYFYDLTPRAITGTASVAGVATKVAVSGVNLDTSYTSANGFVYFLEGKNTLGVDNSIADLSPLLFYFSGAATRSNVVTIAPGSNASLSGSNGLTFTNSTITSGKDGTSIGLSNTDLVSALGALNNTTADLLYTYSGNNITLNSGYNFLLNSVTSYTLNGDLSATNGNIDFAGTLGISGTRSIITNTTGNISISNTINSPAANLTITSAGSESQNAITINSLTVTAPSGITTNGDVSTTANQSYQSAVNLGAGTRTFSSNSGNILFNGAITNGASLTINGATGTATFNGDISVTSFMNITGRDGIFFGASAPQTLTIVWNPGSTGYNFNGPVILQQNLTVTTIFPALQDIIFQNTINSCTGGQCTNGAGPYSLTITTGDNNNNNGSNLTFNGAIGNITPLSSLFAWYQGSNTTFNAPVTVNGDVLVRSEYVASGTNSNSITFATGANLLATGNVTFAHSGGSNGRIASLNLNAAVGSLVNPVSSFTATANAININSSGVVSTNNQSYTGPVTLNNAGAVSLISNSGSVTASSTIAGNSNNLTINNATSGTISGAMSNLALIKNGSGTLILTGTNTYAGGTTINAGTLQIGNGGATGSITGNIANLAALAFNTSSNLTYSNIISGTGTLTQIGSGNLTLNVANTYSGGTNLNAGVLILGSSSTGSPVITSGPIGTGTLTLNSGTLQSSGAFTILNPYTVAGNVTLGGSTNLTLSGAGTLTSGTLTNANTATSTLSGSLNGTTNLTQNGSGILAISGANNAFYSGVTTVTTGTLQIGVATNALGSNNLILNGGNLQSSTTATLTNLYTVGGAVTFAAGNLTMSNMGTLSSGSLAVTNSGSTINLGSLNGSIPITKSGTGALVFSGADYTSFSSDITLNAGTLTAGVATNTFGAGTLYFNGGSLSRLVNTNISNNYVVNGVFTIAPGGCCTPITLSGNGNLNSGSLNFTGNDTNTIISGTLSGSAPMVIGGVSSTANVHTVISGNNISYSGDIFLNGVNGEIGIGSAANALGSGHIYFNAGGTQIGFLTPGVIDNDYTVAAGIGVTRAIYGTGTLSGDGIFNTGSTFNPTGTITLSGNLSGPGNITNNGTLTISGATNNSYSGLLTSSGGTLIIGVATNAIGNGSLALTNATMQATVATSLNNSFTIVGSTIGGSNDISFSGAGTLSSGTLTISNTAQTTFGGSLSGSANLSKTNTGTLLISGSDNNLYTGTTTLSGGTLQIGVASNALGAGTLTLNGGNLQSTVDATLANSFTMGATTTINGSNNLTLTNNGALNTGTLTITNSATTTLSGILSGASGITFNSASGTFILNNANTYTGKTTVTAGTLNINSLANLSTASALGAPTSVANGTIDVGALGVLQYTGNGNSSARVINLTASGGTIDASGSGTLTLSGGVTGNTLGLNLTGTGNATLSGVIATTTGTVTKNGTGTWTLSGNNTYSGITTINGGTLQIGAGSTSGGFGTGNIINNGTLTINRSDTHTLSNLISGTGNLIKSGVGQLTINNSANSYTGTTTINDGTVWVNSLANGGSNSSLGAALASTPIIIDNNGYLRTGGSITTDRSFVIGSNNGSFNAQTTGGTLSGSITTNGVFTIRTDANITVTGTISGNGSLIKAGAFGLTLSGANSYTGSTAINGGTLFANTIGDPGTNTSLGNSSATITLTDGMLHYTGGTASSARPFTIINGGNAMSDIINNGTGTLTLSGDINHTSTGTLRLQGNTNFELSGIISGNLGILKIGGNTVTLSNTASTYTGATSIGFGVIIATHLADGGTPSSLGATIASTPITLSHGHLVYSGGTTSTNRVISVTDPIDNSITTSAAGTLTLAGNITFGGTSYPLTLNASAGNIDVTGVISGAGNLIKSGASTLTLNDANSYTGTTTVNGGILSIATIGDSGTNTALGNSSGTITLGGGTLQYTGTGHTTSRPIYLNNATASIDASGSGALTLTGGVTVLGSRSLILTGTGVASQSGVIALSLGTLTKNGSGTWTLSGANTYNGATTIGAGTLVAEHATALGSTLAGTSITAGATLHINAVAVGAEAITLNGTGVSGNGALISSGLASLSGLITLGSTSSITSTSDTFTISNTGTISGSGNGLTLQGAGNGSIASIIGTGSGTLTKNGTGTWTLSNVASTYTGQTSITNGVLAVSKMSNGGATSSLGSAAAGTAILLGSAGTAGTLSYTGTSDTSNRIVTLGASGGGIDVTSSSGTLTMTGVISGSGGLTKTGAGTLALSATNDFTGTTAISNGVLQLNSYSALGSGATQSGLITIASGGKLAMNVSANGTLANTSTIQVSGAGNDGHGAIGNNLGFIPTLNNPIVLMGNTTVGGFFREFYLNGNITENSVGLTFTKGGPSSYVHLGGNNSFTGATQITGGALIISSANALGTGATQSNGINVSNGASIYFESATVFGNNSTLTLAGSGIAPSIGSLTYAVAAGGTVTLNNPIVLASNVDIGLANGGSSDYLILNGDISGAFSLSKNNLMALTLNGNNTYSGGTIINGNSFGRIEVTHPSGLGTGAININNGGILRINLNNTALLNTNTINISSSATLLENGTGTVTINNPIVMNGAAGLSINAGTAGSNFVVAGNITNNTGNINVNNYTLLGAINGDVTISGIIGNGTGSLAKFGAGTMLTLSNNNTYTGNTTISAGTLQVGNGGATGAIIGNIINSATLIFNTSNSFTNNGVISGSGSITQQGNGTITLGGNNTFDGAFYITSGGINATHGNALGSTVGATTLASGATLTVTGVNVGSEGLNLNGGTFGGSGIASFAGAITLNANSAISNNGGTFTLSNTVNGANDLSLTGAGTTILNAAIGGSTALNSVTAAGNISVGGGAITTTGNQSYQNVATTNDAVFTSTGIGARSIAFNGAITGGNNVTLNGSAAGTYTFTVGGITANNVSVTTAGASSNNVLNLNTAGTQDFTVTSGNTGNVSGISTVGGTFNFSNIHNINGGSGADSFTLSGGTISGSIDGGAGSNSLTGGNAASAWTVSSANGGSVTGIGGTFSNIQNLTGGTDADAFTLAGGSVNSINAGAGADTLTAGNIANTWTISSSNGGSVNGVGAFSNVENVVGGTGSDSFTLAGGTVTGNVDGGAGTNGLIADNVTNTWSVNSANGGTVTGITGTFANIQNLTGGSGTDNFTLAGGTVSGNVDGGAGTNSLIADNVTNSWSIDNANGGTVTGVTGTFANIQNLTGGSGNDTFIMNGGSVAGNVNGGTGTDTLVGANSANTWGITANDTGTLTGIGGTFASMNNLTGGTALDIFNFSEGAAISGLIDGGDITNLNQINFDTFNTTSVLSLILGMPVGGVIDAGLVYDSSNNLLANFARVQMSNGNNVGIITLPNEPSIRVTYYDSSRLNGEIADPFYYFGWILGNPPIIINNTPSGSSGSPAAPIAAINNQPIFNTDNENNYDEYYLLDTGLYTYDDGEYLNLTEISPLFQTTSVKASSMCYAPSNY